MIGLSEIAAVKVQELIEKRPNQTEGLRVGGSRWWLFWLHLLPRVCRGSEQR